MVQRSALREIQALLELEPGREGVGGSVYSGEVKAIAERIGVPYRERTKTWRAIIRALGTQPLPKHVSRNGTITDPGFQIVLDRLREVKAQRGSIPNPLVDFHKGPLHLLIRWRPENNPNTAAEHKAVADQRGSVWWGKLGSANRAALAANQFSRIQTQLAQGSETHVYLYRPGELWRTRLQALEADGSRVDTALVPSNYKPGPEHHLWLRVSDFEPLPPAWAQENLVYASDGQPIEFSGRASMYQVYESERMATAPERYFIFNHGADDQQEGYGDELGKQLGFSSSVSGRIPLIEAQKGRFIYYQTGKHAGAAPSSFVGSGRIERVESIESTDDKERWRAVLDDYRPFATPVHRSVYEPAGWNVQHGISEITQDTYERIVELGNSAEPKVALDFETLRQAGQARGLLVDADVYLAIASALGSGKHIILTGPPGTAKTTLAEVTAGLAASGGLCDGYRLTTATADWTTYETIGGLRPRLDGVGLEFQPGHFLDAISANRWLVIDELNRSNFDRAFGQLFTVLSGQSVVLPYSDSKSGKPVALVIGEELDAAYSDVDYHLIRAAPSWRIIATMNVFDKSLLFEMSFALMRRFAFVEVPAPADAVYQALWSTELEALEPDHRAKAEAALVRLLDLRRVKEIGPAVFLDMARFAVEYLPASDATTQQLSFHLFYSYLLPQFEGIDRVEGQQVFTIVAKTIGAGLRERLRRTLNEVLGLSLASPVQPSTDEEVVEPGPAANVPEDE